MNLKDRHNIYVFGLLLSIIVFSCSDVQNHPEPDNLLPKEKMIDIYSDMILLDAIHRSNPKSLESFGIEVSEHLKNKYNIDSTTLVQNIEYYNFQFETNIEIYEKVSENIESRKVIIDSIVKQRDSLEKDERKRVKENLKDSTASKEKTKLKQFK